MKIKVEYGRVEELGSEYKSVKASFSVEMDISDTELQEKAAQAWRLCHKAVYEQIDTALENEGFNPRFYTGPRYALLRNPHSRAVVLVTEQVADNYFGQFTPLYHSPLGHVPQRGRYETLLGHGVNVALDEEFEFFDASDLSSVDAFNGYFPVVSDDKEEGSEAGKPHNDKNDIPF